MADGNRRHVLPLLRLAEARVADLARGRARSERRRARALDAGVHVRLVVVTDEEEAVTPFERSRQRLQADVVRAAVARERHDRYLPVVGEGVASAEGPLGAVDAGG